jgi:hypothetical protein
MSEKPNAKPLALPNFTAEEAIRRAFQVKSQKKKMAK